MGIIRDPLFFGIMAESKLYGSDDPGIEGNKTRYLMSDKSFSLSRDLYNNDDMILFCPSTNHSYALNKVL